MRFGDWDNMMVKDMPTDSICHLFYLGQNAVVKSSGLYIDPASGNDSSRREFRRGLASDEEYAHDADGDGRQTAFTQ